MTCVGALEKAGLDVSLYLGCWRKVKMTQVSSLSGREKGRPVGRKGELEVGRKADGLGLRKRSR